MRSILSILTVLLFITAGFAQATAEKLSLKQRIEMITGVEVVNTLEATDHFTEVYEIWFRQKIDPNNDESETFLQKVLLGHVGYEQPVIVELEGYQIWSAESGELTTMFTGNQLTIEHRFFAESRPEGEIPWEQLTIENAAYDQHVIIERIKNSIYPDSKFISTGISKGGQTTMIHRSFYQEDVDASVCYVAPLNFEREDPRIYEFLATVGTEKQREKVKDFQILCLKNKEELTELLASVAKRQGFSWPFNTEKAIEYYILEYSFAFWQWGSIDFNEIPGKASETQEILSHLLEVSGLSFFESQGVEELRPYFWAALTQEGIYGYLHEPFEKYLSQQSTYTFDFAFPEGISLEFDPEPMRKLNEFIQTEATEMIFVYGGLDTWSATGVELTDEAKARGLKKYTLENGHHGTRIANFPKKTQEEIKATIESWIE